MMVFFRKRHLTEDEIVARADARKWNRGELLVIAIVLVLVIIAICTR